MPALLAEAFGSRLLRDDGTSILVDDHGHDHGEPHAPELVPHHGLHQHQHQHQPRPAAEPEHDGDERLTPSSIAASPPSCWRPISSTRPTGAP